MGLLWTRLIVGAMGQPLHSAFLAFQSLATLGGLGDLGMGGAVGLRVGQFLGQRREKDAREFLNSTRAVFVLLAALAGVGLLLCSPWLPGALKLRNVAGVGPSGALMAVGAVAMVVMVLGSYVSNVNYACNNLVWPVVPAFFLLQLCLLSHWLLARQNQPLWIQYLPYLGSAAFTLVLMLFYVRASHPLLANLLPLKLDAATSRPLLQSSFWAYLCSLGSVIYVATDPLVIQNGFAPGQVTPYNCNYKLCELSLFVVVSASYVSMPKITQWLVSHPARAREQGSEIEPVPDFSRLRGGARLSGRERPFHAGLVAAQDQSRLARHAAFAGRVCAEPGGHCRR